jgi:hypothetical protein
MKKKTLSDGKKIVFVATEVSYEPNRINGHIDPVWGILEIKTRHISSEIVIKLETSKYMTIHKVFRELNKNKIIFRMPRKKGINKYADTKTKS